MELEQIKIFVSAAKAGSFSKAAEELYVSHSTVSRTISALERELGVALFSRDSRGVALTEDGRALYEGGSGLLSEAEALERRISRKGDKDKP